VLRRAGSGALLCCCFNQIPVEKRWQGAPPPRGPAQNGRPRRLAHCRTRRRCHGPAGARARPRGAAAPLSPGDWRAAAFGGASWGRAGRPGSFKRGISQTLAASPAPQQWRSAAVGLAGGALCGWLMGAAHLLPPTPSPTRVKGAMDGFYAQLLKLGFKASRVRGGGAHHALQLGPALRHRRRPRAARVRSLF
jgi:hypothetical protein